MSENGAFGAVGELIQEFATSVKKCKELEEQIATRTKERDEANKRHRNLLDQRDRAREERDTFHEMLAGVTRSRDMARDEVDKLRTELRAKAATDQVGTALDDLRAEHAAYKKMRDEQCECLQARIDNLETENAGLMVNLDKASKEIPVLWGAIEMLTGQLNRDHTLRLFL